MIHDAYDNTKSEKQKKAGTGFFIVEVTHGRKKERNGFDQNEQ